MTNKPFDIYYFTKNGELADPNSRAVQDYIELKIERFTWKNILKDEDLKNAHVQEMPEEERSSFIRPDGSFDKKAIDEYLKAQLSNANFNYIEHALKYGIMDRCNDAEAKLILDLDDKYDQDDPEKLTGNLTLTSHREFCPACLKLIKQFIEKYPNIKLDLEYAYDYKA